MASKYKPNKIYLKMEDKKAEEFNELVRPVMKWMAENLHPHTKIIIEANNAELLEGFMNMNTNDYIMD